MMSKTKEVKQEAEQEPEETKEELQAQYFEKIHKLREAEAKMEKIQKEKEVRRQ